MSAETASDGDGLQLTKVVSNNVTASLPSPQEAALQELWLRILDMTAGASSGVAPSPSSDPLALPRRPLSPQVSRQPRSYVRPANAPPTPGSSRSRMKRRGKDDHWDLDSSELHEGMYGAIKSHPPDWWISHFLRANDFDVGSALDDLLRHVHWRCRIMDVDADILPNGEAAAVRLKGNPGVDSKAKKIAEGFLGIIEQDVCRILKGRDRSGRKMGLVNVKNHRRGQYPIASYERYTVYHTETARLMEGTGAGDGILIFDFDDYKTPNMDYRPVKTIIQMMKNLYPQTLGDVILHRAPPLIMPVWALIKPLVREEFLSHLHFTKDLADLERFIPFESIPKQMGGGGDASFQYEYPDLSDPMNGGGGHEVQAQRDYERTMLHEERKEVIRLFEETTKEWINASREGREIRGLKTLRDKYGAELVTSYWRLDPYVRARSIYDRLGWIQPPQV